MGLDNTKANTESSSLYSVDAMEMENYLSQVQEKADKISDKFIILFFLLGLGLAFVYQTWAFSIVTGLLNIALYAMARFVLLNKFYARMIISVVYAVFMLQFIGQMHGMAEIHFFFFTNIALLIIYQDWRIMIPYTVLTIGHHSILAIVQVNAAAFELDPQVIGNYFITYGGKTIEGESVNYVTTFQLFFHFGIVAMMAFVCGWWAIIFRQNSMYLKQKELEAQLKSKALQTSEEELRQNYEELQTTQEQLLLIQALIDNSQDAVQAARTNGRFVYMNKVAGKRFGISPQECSKYFVYELESIFNNRESWDAHVEEVKQLEGITIESENINLSTKQNIPVEVGVKYININGEGYMMASSRDISEQKKAERLLKRKNEALQASEEELRQNYEELQATQEELHLQKQRLEQIFNGIPAMIYQFKMTTDGQMSLPVVSRGAEAIYGLSAQEIMQDVNLILNPIVDEDKLFFQQTLQESANKLTEWKADIKLDMNGKTMWIRGTSKPVKNEDDSILWSGIIQDITSEKQLEEQIRIKNQELLSSEEELRQNYEELQTTQELITNAFSELDAQFRAISTTLGYVQLSTERRVERVNELFASWLGYDIDELKGKAHHELIPTIEEEQEKYQQLWKMLERGQTCADIFRRRTKDGKDVWLYGAYCPVKDKDGNVIKIIKVASNYNEQKKYEEQIEEQKENLEKSLVELKTTQNQLIQAEKLSSLGQLVASIAHEINTPLGAIRSSASTMEDTLEGTLTQLPNFLIKLDPTTLSHFSKLITLSSQKTTNLSTRQKRTIKYDLMDELKELSIDDAEVFADWVMDMNVYDEKEVYLPLLKLDNAREVFQVAYQLIMIIQSNKTIRMATDRAAKIVFALKNFARQEQSEVTSKVLLNESLETTLTLYHSKLKHGIEVMRDFQDIPEFMGYPDELIQVWTNLIHNAIQAMNGKGELTIQTRFRDNNVLVAIQDTGGGIPKNIQERIFDAFFTTKAAGEGSGLGLDITKKIVEKHHGRIWYETEEGIGTTFFVEIPLT